MSTVTTLVLRRRHPRPVPVVPGPSAATLQRVLRARRPRRWDDRPGVERDVTPSEHALRSVVGVHGLHR